MFAFKEFVVVNSLDLEGLEARLATGELAVILQGEQKFISNDKGETNALLSSAIGLDEYQRINRCTAKELKRRVRSGKNMVLKVLSESYVLNTSISEYLTEKLQGPGLIDSPMGPELATQELFAKIYPGKEYSKIAEKDTAKLAKKALKSNIVDFTENHTARINAQVA